MLPNALILNGFAFKGPGEAKDKSFSMVGTMDTSHIGAISVEHKTWYAECNYLSQLYSIALPLWQR